MRKIDLIRMSSQARSGPTAPWPGHSPFRRSATMTSASGSCGDRASCCAAALGHLRVWASGRYG
ncbi:hypothetical protein PI124_g910 [Phytophthora idaei]|nr:hypothetical protein PI125_g5385 [Phytophthora idaei]KAG3174009.1 hypothetical protein PI126_g592 [Phytophthora idaei]KAG3254516.1 hypothetical protein PI124_g910 [Phytophthora idaei]